MILRRLYLYLVSAAGLALLAAGLALLGDTVVLFVFNDPSAQYSRGELAGFSAMALVALPVWGVHFFFARRFAMRDPSERASAIRRAYLYAACLAGSLVALVVATTTISGLLHPLLDRAAFGSVPTFQAAWTLAVAGAVWWSHSGIAARDRAAAGETGASSTLRRWYMYTAALVGLLTLLAGASQLLNLAWIKLVTGSLQNWQSMSDAAGEGVAGALLWALTWRSIGRHHLEEDRHSTLRALQGFIAVGVGIATALFGGSQILYYVLARALGVNNPGGVGNNLAAGLAGPVSLVAVYGVAWLLVGRRLARDARSLESDRQAGIRRLYTNLAALVALAAGAIGAGGLLWNLVEQVEARAIGVGANDWRDPVSLWATLLGVGTAVWLAHWRPAPPAQERQSLSRRLYVWAALLASVLAVLGGGVGMLTALLRQVFSTSPKLADTANLDFGHYLAVIAVAAGVGVYHWRILRADAAARPAKPAEERAHAPIAAGAGAPAASNGSRRYTLVVSGATEEELTKALAALPPEASYKLSHERS